MREFVTAVEEVLSEDERTAKIKALVDGGMAPEDARIKVLEEEGVIVFKVDDRVIHAYPPNEGQLTFMLAALGRGQDQSQRYASIVNIMMACLHEDDKDYLEGRMLSRDPRTRLPISKIEEIFEYLIEEWFARPTQGSSDSATSQQTSGPNLTPSTTPSPEG